MTIITILVVILSIYSLQGSANVEKIVFFGPEHASDLPQLPHHDFLVRLESLDSFNSTIRRKLHAKFESSSLTITEQEQSEAWILLNSLEARRRYEIRICWPATVSAIYAAQSMLDTDSPY